MISFLIILILFFSIVIHEYSHGWVAYRLGDPTAKLAGRLTLNPLTHIDMFGTIILPISLLILSRGHFSFGYAKPIPINPYNFRRPRKDIMWVGIAGPLSNILISAIMIILIKLKIPAYVYPLLVYGIFINLILAIFNLLPIPPLDGSKIVAALLPPKYVYQYLKLEILGFMVIVILIASGFLHWFVFPLIQAILSLFNVDLPVI
jgi:Zn-dependent protease